MPKLVCALLMLVMTSGCCELFGICTSVHVHTSAPSPNKIAGLGMNGGSERSVSSYGRSAQSGLAPGGINDGFQACS
jgi:hypothetical protein